MRILVTGANGFVGKHLCAYLRSKGDEVIEGIGPRENGNSPGVNLDVTDALSVRDTLAKARPEGIVHLAGFSSVGKSHKEPSKAFKVNALGSVNVLAAVREVAPRACVVLVGSGEMYGPLPKDVRATEGMPLRPTSPYASSKAAAELIAQQFARSYDVQVVLARSFNHLGTGQDPSFVAPTLAAQIQAIARGRADPIISVGDLTPIRDFSHVDDIVAGYRLLLAKGESGEAYNLCSGSGRSIRSVLDEMLEIAGVKAEVTVDRARLRPSEIPTLVGDPSKMTALGWKPECNLREALFDVLEEYGKKPAVT